MPNDQVTKPMDETVETVHIPCAINTRLDDGETGMKIRPEGRNGFSWSLEIDLDGKSQLAITLSCPYPNVSPRSRI